MPLPLWDHSPGPIPRAARRDGYLYSLQEVCSMYSVVLLMAMTSGGEVAEARGCRGCSCASSCARPAKGCKRDRCHCAPVYTCHCAPVATCYSAPVAAHGCAAYSGGHHGHHGHHVAYSAPVSSGYAVVTSEPVTYSSEVVYSAPVSTGVVVSSTPVYYYYSTPVTYSMPVSYSGTVSAGGVVVSGGVTYNGGAVSYVVTGR